jgi:uncharacterized protein YbaR (Trm112 family)
MALRTLSCPECRQPSLICHVVREGDSVDVTLVEQTCTCDPFDAWDDVWEEAREMVCDCEKRP